MWAREQRGGLYRFQEMNTKHLGQAVGRRGPKGGKSPRVTVEGTVEDKMTVWMCGKGGGTGDSKVTSPRDQECLLWAKEVVHSSLSSLAVPCPSIPGGHPGSHTQDPPRTLVLQCVTTFTPKATPLFTLSLSLSLSLLSSVCL